MRTHSRCPKCNGTKLYVVENRQPESDSSNGIAVLRVATPSIDHDEVGAKNGSRYRTEVGSFETWICAGCGYTEWYAKDPEHLLEKLAKRRDSGVRVVDGAPETPYR
jgi:predicted nucleic-acid-binding Zn-ribbon protein